MSYKTSNAEGHVDFHPIPMIWANGATSYSLSGIWLPYHASGGGGYFHFALVVPAYTAMANPRYRVGTGEKLSSPIHYSACCGS